MSQLYGVGLDIEIKRVCTQLKMQIVKRGGIGMRALAITLARADIACCQTMDAEEFESALASFNLFPTKKELQAFMKAFGCDGRISYEKFVDALREPMSARRRAVVDLCFEKIDTNCCGCLSVDELIAAYDVSCNQDAIDGKYNKEQIV
jgi:Ca2+-binding EF-hand superfamily protein